MKQIKLGWAVLTVADKIVKAISVVDCIGNHPLTYATPEPPLEDVRDQALLLLTAEAKALRGGTDRTIERNVELDNLTEMMNHLVDYVQLVSQGDPLKVAQAGLDLADEPSPWPIPGRVGNAQAQPGGNPGTILVSWDKVTYKKSYSIEIWVETEGAGGEVSGIWASTVVYKLEHQFMGLVSGRTYRFRVAAQNSAGMGSYSEEASCVAR
jgi:hypothetical protein